MCGIFGWISSAGRVDPAALAHAGRVLRHRGPDDEGYLLAAARTGSVEHFGGDDTPAELALPRLPRDASGRSYELGFAFRRLSIIDLSVAGHQPMRTPDGRFWLIFNGEVYNYVELRRELEAQGHQFSSNADTEVVLAAYRAWGERCLERFVGMWALAIWDVSERKLFLARDPFGIKPLYIKRTGDGLLFASEIKALIDLPEPTRVADRAAVFDYLRLGLTDHTSATLFAGVEHLPPAHSLTIRADEPQRAQAARYWAPTAGRQSLSFSDAAEGLAEIFRRNVRLHLRSDVPVGTALSGGIDSSAIVSTIRAVDPAARLSTFSFIPDDESVNEERWIDLMNDRIRADVHKVRPLAGDIVKDIDQLIWSQDEPFGSTSIYAQNRIFRMVADHGVRVMLDGQGADEMLGGYQSFFAARWAGDVRRGALASSARFMRNISALPGVRSRSVALEAAGLLIPSRIQGPLRHMVGREALPSWLNAEYFRGFDPAAAMRKRGSNDGRGLRGALLDSLTRTSLPRLLRYEDRNSMAHSIESRVPFLTTELADFVLSLPEDYIISEDATTKAVFRQAMRGVVPDAILDRRDKIGFATPETNWMRVLRPWISRVLQSERVKTIPAVDAAVASRDIERALGGETAWQPWMWRWINFIRWVERFEVRFD